MTSTDILNKVKVLDLGRGHAASKAAGYLRQAGAQVAKAELAGRPSALSELERALWDAGKTQVSLAGAGPRGWLQTQLAEVDVVVHDFLPAEAASLGLDRAGAEAAHSRLIVLSVSGWPVGHPLEAEPVDDILALAEAGVLDEQSAVGREGPVYLRFPLGGAHAAYLGAIGVLARLYARARTGRGGAVGVSLVQGALVPMMMHWSQAERTTSSVALGSPKHNVVSLFQCSDGLWVHVMGPLGSVPEVRVALDAMDPQERARLNGLYADHPVKYMEDHGACEAVLKTRPRDEWLELVWQADIAAQPVLTAGTLLSDPQATANGLVEEAQHPQLGRLRRSAFPVQVEAPVASGPGGAVQPAMLRYPLEGLRVLDCGNFLAGPLGAMILGDLGAEVIKLEASSGDPMRRIEWAFNGCQRNKRALALQLKDPRSKPVLERLVRWADVVHHNQRLPAAERLGLGREDVRILNPAAVYCHISSYGAAGARRHWPGFDQLFQAASGWELEGAGEGNSPTWHRFGMMDHLCALSSVLGVLLALLARDAGRQGGSVAASLLGASLDSLETALGEDGRPRPTAKLDGRQLGVSAFRRLYQCADGWVALAARKSELDASAAETLSDVAVMEQHLLGLPVNAALAYLQGLGAPARQVRLDNRDRFFADDGNRLNGLVSDLAHPVYGRLRAPGRFFDFGDLDVRLDRAPPLPGQHSREVLDELGFAAAEIETLIKTGVVAASPSPGNAADGPHP